MEIIGQNVTIFTDIKHLQVLCENAALSRHVYTNRFFVKDIKFDFKHRYT